MENTYPDWTVDYNEEFITGFLEESNSEEINECNREGRGCDLSYLKESKVVKQYSLYLEHALEKLWLEKDSTHQLKSN